MGICIHAKEIIYSSKICNVPVVIEENKVSPHNNNDNTNNNSVNNNDNNNNNSTNIKNINLQNNNNNINLNIKPKLEEKKRRSILLVKKENKLQEAAETKLENEEEEKNEKNEKNEKHEKKNKKDHQKKKVAFQPNKDQETNSNVEPDEKSKDKLHKRKRGHSINNAHKKIKFEMSEIENKSNNENQEKPNKFQRNKKKYATLKDKAPRLDDKLRGIENKIPVMQETLVTQKFGDPDKYYKKIKDLGSGSYGAVYLAKNVVMDNIVAIKTIEKTEDNMVDDLEIKNEINILKKLSHPNIVKVYEFFDTILYYYIVTEYCKKGELFSYIKNRYSERQLSVLFYQVFSGLCYLHEKKIIHRDLKLENIMVSDVEKDVTTGEEYFWIKI